MPEGTDPTGGNSGFVQTWNAGGCCPPATDNRPDDVAFVRAVLDWAEATFCLDKNRLFATGFSNGGMMSYRLACELSDRLAAIAPVAGPNMTDVAWGDEPPGTCNPSRRLPLLHIHARGDQHAPYEGGKGSCFEQTDAMRDVSFPPVSRYTRAWATANGCASGPDVPWTGASGAVQAGNENPCVLLGGHCPATQSTVVCNLPAGGHAYPGASGEGPVRDCADEPAPRVKWFNAAEAVWSFFAAHPRQ
jgi:polyhydroxybutyrate depolymerase